MVGLRVTGGQAQQEESEDRVLCELLLMNVYEGGSAQLAAGVGLKVPSSLARAWPRCGWDWDALPQLEGPWPSM